MSTAPKICTDSELQRALQEAGKKIEDQGGLLSADETGRLQSLEAVIEKGRQTFIDVGMALTEIKEKRLWKEYGSFKGYLEKRWNFSRQFAYMQISAYEAAKDVTTVVDTPNEATAREFVNVPKEDRPKVAEKAKAIAAEHGRANINSRDVKEAKAKVYKVETKVTEIDPEPGSEPLPESFEPEPTLADDDEDAWLESLPLHGMLQATPLRKFVEAARVWYALEPQFKMLASAVRKAHRQVPAHLQSRFFVKQLASFVIDDPKHWVVCKVCSGTGQVPKVGQCSSCTGDGFYATQFKK